MGMMLMPPDADKCQQCATDHDPEQPHNQGSMYWKYLFYAQHGRWPTWADAIEHCSEAVRLEWIESMEACGIKVE